MRVIEDGEDPPNPWRGYRKCLSDLPEFGHIAVLQDDTTVCHNFAPTLELIAEHNPDTPVSLFLSKIPKRTLNLAMLRQGRSRYVDCHPQDLIHAISIIWPVGKAREFMDWIQDNPKRIRGDQFSTSDDANLTRWFSLTGQRFRCTVPSLVQHLDDVPSIVNSAKVKNGRDGGRTAAYFIGDVDPLGLNWAC